MAQLASCRVGALSCLESIADATNADDVTGLGRLRLDLASQLDDVRIDDAIGYMHVVAPDRVDHLRSSQDSPRIAEKRLDHLQFDGGQIQAHTRATQFGA